MAGSGGMPSGGGSGGRGSTGTNDKREVISSIPWIEVRLTAAPVVTPKAGEAAAPKTEDEHLREVLRIHRMDPRPTFLYFHYPHEDLEKPGVSGRVSKKQCEMLADDAFARWGMLVKCFEVDAEKSDPKILARLGVGEGASFAIVDEKLQVVAQSSPFATAKTAGAFVKQAVSTRFPDYWKALQERVEEQKKLLAEARTLAKQKKFEGSLARYDAVVDPQPADPGDDRRDGIGPVARSHRCTEADDGVPARVALAVPGPPSAERQLDLDHRLEPVDVRPLQHPDLDQPHGPGRIATRGGRRCRRRLRSGAVTGSR